jgi:glycosyltransferase involved in cell wall biosynthesis
VIHNVAEGGEPSEQIQLKHPCAVIVGRLVPVKRVDVAVQAFAHVIPELKDGAHRPHLYIAGSGPLREDIEAAIENLQLNDDVTMMGFRNDAAAVIAASDCLMITSLSEGVPTVLLEAMLSGVPVVSSDLPGIREIKDLFPSYPLFLQPVGDAITAAANVAKVLSEKPKERLASEMTNRIRSYFAPQRAAEQHLKVYQSLSGA